MRTFELVAPRDTARFSQAVGTIRSTTLADLCAPFNTKLSHFQELVCWNFFTFLVKVVTLSQYMIKRKYLSQCVTSLNLRTPPSSQSSSQFSPTPPAPSLSHFSFSQFKLITKCDYSMIILWLLLCFMLLLWNNLVQKSFTINADKICSNVMLEPVLYGVKLSSVHRSPRPHQVRTWHLAMQRLPGLVKIHLLFQMKYAVF